ncbi:MAG: hypothetical protein GY765_37550 [bacterium]|nr:hypothetical protein [bacterium]
MKHQRELFVRSTENAGRVNVRAIRNRRTEVFIRLAVIKAIKIAAGERCRYDECHQGFLPVFA